MLRRRGAILLLLVLAAVAVGCGSDKKSTAGAGSSASSSGAASTSAPTTTPRSSTTSTTSTTSRATSTSTSTASSSTTTSAPASAPATAEAAARGLVERWGRGDRDGAAAFATQDAIATLFATNGDGNTWMFQGCEGVAGGGVCSFSYEGGGANMHVQDLGTIGETGFRVDEIRFVAD